jgi:pimeloyl-ACP methyl ester carboxylesterase
MVEKLIATIGAGIVSLVGHDIGGGVALRFASHNPESVEQLVLSNAVCYDSWPLELVVEIGLPTVLEEAPEKLDQLLEAAFSEEFMAATPEDAFVEGMHAPWESEEGRLSLVRNAAALNTNHTTELDDGAISADTVLLWGVDDFAQPITNAERLAEDVSDAQVVELDDAGHWVMEDSMEAYVDHVHSFFERPSH